MVWIIPINQVKFLLFAYLVQNITHYPLSINFELLSIFLSICDPWNADIRSHTNFTFPLKEGFNQNISSSGSYLKEGMHFRHNLNDCLGIPLSVGEEDRGENIRFDKVLPTIEDKSMLL